MSKWGDDLQQVIALNKAVKPAEAEERLTSIIQECPLTDLRVLDAQVTAALRSFLPRRRRLLESILKQRRESDSTIRAVISGPSALITNEPPPSATHESAPSPADEGSSYGGIAASPVRDIPAPGAAEPSRPGEVTNALNEITRLNDSVQPGEAEARFRVLVESLEPSGRAEAEAELRQSLQGFLPKRRRTLTELLDGYLATPGPEPAAAPEAYVMSPPQLATAGHAEVDELRPARPARPRPPLEPHRTKQLTYMNDRFSGDLDRLSDLHIFQWATFYRDTLSEYFDSFLEFLSTAERPKQLINLVRSALSIHAREIYGKGYAYVTTHNSSDAHYAITKSLTGLQRFLDLPLEFYSARLADAHHNRIAGQLRQLCSAMVFGAPAVHGWGFRLVYVRSTSLEARDSALQRLMAQAADGAAQGRPGRHPRRLVAQELLLAIRARLRGRPAPWDLP